MNGQEKQIIYSVQHIIGILLCYETTFVTLPLQDNSTPVHGKQIDENVQELGLLVTTLLKNLIEQDIFSA